MLYWRLFIIPFFRDSIRKKKIESCIPILRFNKIYNVLNIVQKIIEHVMFALYDINRDLAYKLVEYSKKMRGCFWDRTKRDGEFLLDF